MADLLPGQIEIDGLRIGKGTRFILSEFIAGGKPDATTKDRDHSGADGRVFSIDTLTGRTIELGITVDTQNIIDGSRAYSELARVWNAKQTRYTEGGYVAMRMRLFGALPTRVVYGRPRKFDPANERLLDRGRVDVVADFDAIDDLFYTDSEAVEPLVVPIVPPQTGGWTLPSPMPVTFSTTSEGFGEFEVAGYEPAPMVARIHGPILNPVIDLLGGWQVRLMTSLAYDQWVDIDARPWSRSVMRSDGANLAGAFDGATPPLSDLLLMPGHNEVVLRGTDLTGTAYLTLTWQGAATTPWWV